MKGTQVASFWYSGRTSYRYTLYRLLDGSLYETRERSGYKNDTVGWYYQGTIEAFLGLCRASYVEGHDVNPNMVTQQ